VIVNTAPTLLEIEEISGSVTPNDFNADPFDQTPGAEPWVDADTTATLPPLHYMLGWLDHYRPDGDDATQVAYWARGLALEVGHLRQTMADFAAVPQPRNREELTPTELRVFRYLRNTLMSQPEIARAMFVSINTVKTHAKNIYRKTGVSRREQLRNVESQ